VTAELTLLHLVNTLLEHVDTLPSVDVGVPPLVHCAERDVDTQTVRGVRNDCFGAEVVDPVEVGEGRGRVVPREEEIDGVR
jgi:hypothetical protein